MNLLRCFVVPAAREHSYAALCLGQSPPVYQGLTLGARLLLSKGRPCWRKLILGRGAEEDLQKGISGNTILLAQARPRVPSSHGGRPGVPCGPLREEHQ